MSSISFTKVIISNTTLSSLSLIFLYYLILILALISLIIYLKAININSFVKGHSAAIIGKAGLSSLVISLAVCLILFLRFIRVIGSSVMFGHVVISKTAFNLTILIIILYIMSCLTIILERLSNSIEALSILFIASLLCIILSALWLAGSYYSMLFCLDCINILIMSAVFSTGTQGTNSNAKSSYFVKLSGISIYFWSAFIASILLLIAGAAMSVNLLSTDIRSAVLTWSMLSSCEIGLSIKSILVIVLIIFGITIKCGVGPFFIWKQNFFTAMNPASIVIYVFFYFSIVFIYFINILITLLPLVTPIVSTTLIVLTLISSSILLISIDNGSSIQKFFVLSTAINALLVICFVLCISTIFML